MAKPKWSITNNIKKSHSDTRLPHLYTFQQFWDNQLYQLYPVFFLMLTVQ